MTTSTQTKTDLKSILETLDQRLFEQTQDPTDAPEVIAGMRDVRRKVLALIG